MKNAYRIINRAIRQSRLSGLQLARGEWGVKQNWQTMRYYLPNGCGCPIALVLAGKKVDPRCTDRDVAAARIIGKPKAWIRSFIWGYDGSPCCGQHKDAYNFGKRVYNKYRAEL